MSSIQEIEAGNFAERRWTLSPPDAIRLVSWNINRGMQFEAVVDFLARVKADIVLLQESDLNARRTRRVNVGRTIAQKLRMNYVFGREFEELTQGSRSSPAYHGQATFSRWALSSVRILRFKKQSNFWYPRWFLPDIAPFQERIGGRMALISETEIAGKAIVTYNLHLESKGDDALRCAQLDEALQDSRRYDKETPIVLAGDFNLDASERRTAAAIGDARFRNAFADRHTPTTPSSFLEQGRSIDWICTRGSLDASESQVHRSVSASDHYPLSVVLAFT